MRLRVSDAKRVVRGMGWTPVIRRRVRARPLNYFYAARRGYKEQHIAPTARLRHDWTEESLRDRLEHIPPRGAQCPPQEGRPRQADFPAAAG